MLINTQIYIEIELFFINKIMFRIKWKLIKTINLDKIIKSFIFTLN